MEKRYILIIDEDADFTRRVFDIFKGYSDIYCVRTANTVKRGLNRLCRRVELSRNRFVPFDAVFSSMLSLQRDVEALGIDVEFVHYDKPVMPEELTRDIDYHFVEKKEFQQLWG